ncbi:LytTR family DNA-binding domain-containing protein [Clostridiaceae bacterium M8S5]|nr:LytTR family DNA-binding domain-containing protein [Clostridiaceae bacterium M8S5]
MSNILVVEDDQIQRQNLVKILKNISNDIKVYQADNKSDAVRISKAVKMDFFFIDMMLNDSTGLDTAKELRKMKEYKLTWIIFLTTHVSYMLQAFKEVHCYDYILKPYKKSEIINVTKLLLDNSYESTKKDDRHRESIVFELQGVMLKIYVDEIYFVEVNLRTCILHTKSGNYSLNRKSLKSILSMIKADYIIQTHKSYAVNVNYIDKIEKISRGIWEIHFHGYEEQALLASTYKNALKEKFME